MAAIACNTRRPEPIREDLNTSLSRHSREPAAVTTQFKPLDPGIINDAIPAFFIGRNRDGFWVARAVNGRIGGIFLLENSAVSFAKRHSRPTGCATIYPSGRFELDLENRGNPLILTLASSMHFAVRVWRGVARLISG